MFTPPKRAVPWFGSFFLLMVVPGLLEGKLQSFRLLTPMNIIISFVMNLGGVSGIVFFLLKYFVSERERTITALDAAHRRVRHSLSLAMEVQQNLLPDADPKIDGLDIAGKSIYCDETGGDYYDFLKPVDAQKGQIGIVVGDVSEHGIPSALLMATARAIIRQRTSSPGSLSEIVSDVNRELARDVEDSGRFMTLFYAVLDSKAGSIRWVSAGHEPAIIYDPNTDAFIELTEASGFPLGIMEDAEFEEARRDIAAGQIIVSATDGIIEARNPKDDMFGRERLYDTIRKNVSGSAQDILNAILNTLNRFKAGTQSEDDITLVVIKIERNF